MFIHHLAIWCFDLERVAAFYERYFDASRSARYENPAKGFSSYFMSFESGAKVELMSRKDIPANTTAVAAQRLGLTHVAVSVGSRERVDSLTATLEKDGFTVESQPRTTGDGYYESVILDPENNRIEITA